jgi:hypothetical protein
MGVARNGGRIRSALGSLGLLFASLLVSLIGVEMLLRWDVIPNEYYLRHHILGSARQRGPFIFILGDSFMAGRRGRDIVDDLYAILAPHGVRILNTATPGTGPVQYLESLRREGPRHRPDMVLLSYYVGNDLQDVGCGDVGQHLQAVEDQAPWKRLYVARYVRERLRAVFPGRVFFQSMLPMPRALVAALRSPFPPSPPAVQQVDYDRMRAAGIPEQYIEEAKAGKVNPWIVDLGVTHPDYFRDELLIRSDCAKRAWQNVTQVLDSILAEAARLEASVFPVIFPHTLQVSRAHYALYRAWKLNIDDEMLKTDRPQELLRDYFHAHGIEPLDLLDAFRADTGRMYWEQDEHMNPHGERVAATLIAQGILKRYPQLVGVRRPTADDAPSADEARGRHASSATSRRAGVR